MSKKSQRARNHNKNIRYGRLKKIFTLFENLLVNRYFQFTAILITTLLALLALNFNEYIIATVLFFLWASIISGIYRSQWYSNNKCTKPYFLIMIAIILCIATFSLYLLVLKPHYYNTYYIKPGRESTPSLRCEDIRSDDFLILLGNNSLILNGNTQYFKVLKYDDIEILSVRSSPEGLLISGILNDPDGNQVCKIKDNKFIVNKNGHFIIDRPNEHELYIKNRSDRIFLGVKFLNKDTVSISGIFSVKNFPTVVIDNEVGIKNMDSQSNFINGCFYNVGVIIHCKSDINYPGNVIFEVCGDGK